MLWDTSLRDYTNREKRAVAYEQLVPIYRYLKKDATVEDVKKKINTLRTNYRKELKVVETARQSGNHHQPRCWTFQELDFLRNTEKFLAVNPGCRGAPKTESSFFNEITQTQGSFVDGGTPFHFRNPLQTPPTISEMFHKTFGLNANIASTNGENGVAIKRQRLSPGSSSQGPNDEIMGIASDYLSPNYPEEESVARTWTLKLRRMQKDQRLLAEKFINEILYEAETGGLHRGCMHINHFEPYARFAEPAPIKTVVPSNAPVQQVAQAAAQSAAEQQQQQHKPNGTTAPTNTGAPNGGFPGYN